METESKTCKSIWVKLGPSKNESSHFDKVFFTVETNGKHDIRR